PSNFSSLILQTAPGYREAYAACLILRLGLRIEGGPLQLSLKDINALYEYWCYLAVIKLVAEELGADLDARDFVNVTSRGLRIDVTKSRSKRVLLSGAKGRANKENGFVGGPSNPVTVALTYNPAFDTPTGRHRPDVGLSIKVDGWQAPFEVILDAKY